MISLAGKAALITGGSRGIGAAAVKLFAQAGADVVFSYVKAKDAALQDSSNIASPGSGAWTFWWPMPASGTSRICPSKK